MMYNHERKALCFGSEQTYVNENKTLILTFVMEHCPYKLAKYLLDAFVKRTEMLKVLWIVLVPRRLNIYVNVNVAVNYIQIKSHLIKLAGISYFGFIPCRTFSGN